MTVIRFTVPGRIGGKQRVGRDFRHGARAFNPHKTESAEAMIRWYAAEQMRGKVLMLGAVHLQVEVTRVPPKSWSKKKAAKAWFVTGKPDCDNTIKLISDALNGIVWRDDAQVSVLTMVRHYAEIEQVDIRIEELEEAS